MMGHFWRGEMSQLLSASATWLNFRCQQQHVFLAKQRQLCQFILWRVGVHSLEAPDRQPMCTWVHHTTQYNTARCLHVLGLKIKILERKCESIIDELRASDIDNMLGWGQGLVLFPWKSHKYLQNIHKLALQQQKKRTKSWNVSSYKTILA